MAKPARDPHAVIQFRAQVLASIEPTEHAQAIHALGARLRPEAFGRGATFEMELRTALGCIIRAAIVEYIDAHGLGAALTLTDVAAY